MGIAAIKQEGSMKKLLVVLASIAAIACCVKISGALPLIVTTISTVTAVGMVRKYRDTLLNAQALTASRVIKTQSEKISPNHGDCGDKRSNKMERTLKNKKITELKILDAVDFILSDWHEYNMEWEVMLSATEFTDNEVRDERLDFKEWFYENKVHTNVKLRK